MTEPSDTKVCPDCAETVKSEARVCRFCGYRFDGMTGGMAVEVAAPPAWGAREGFLLWALASALLMAIGSFGPWIGTFGMSVAGTDGSNDGWLVVGAAAGGALCVVLTRKYRGGGLWALVAGVIAAAVTIYDRAHASDLISRQSTFLQAIIHIGWGLNLALVASISFALCGVIWVLVLENEPGIAEKNPPAG